MIKKRIFGLFFVVTFISIQSFSQTLDQQLRQAQTTGQISEEEAKNLATLAPKQPITLSNVNSRQFFKKAPDGISSLFSFILKAMVRMYFIMVFGMLFLLLFLIITL